MGDNTISSPAPAAYGVQLEESGYDKRFKELIRKLSQREKVVILVDEYDKPIINHIENPGIAKQNRDILRTFYEAIKGASLQILQSLHLLRPKQPRRHHGPPHKFATLLGYTHDDVLHFIDRGKFGNFWFSTSTPTFLINFIRQYNIDVKRIENYETNQLLFDSFDIERINVFALLFQTGYLTIKEVNEISPTQTIYRLSYPNQEVKEAFLEYIAAKPTTTPPNATSGIS